MNRAPYRVYYLNNLIATYGDREAALDYVNACAMTGKAFGDFEILDASDEG
jgi:hypothetical protein